MKRVLPLFALIGMIFLAGCLGMQGEEKEKKITGRGVVITDLTVEPEELEPGMQAMVSLTIQNQGGAKATNIVPTLIGLPDDWQGKDSPDPSQIAELIPPDPERGVPEGQEAYVTWMLTAPSKKVTMTYDFQVRITYDYETHSSSVIRLLTMDYYKSLTQTEKETKNWGVISSEYTDGPLVVSVSAPSPIISDFSKFTNGLPIWVKIENEGGGSVVGDIQMNANGVRTCKFGNTTGTSLNISLISNDYGRFVCYLDIGPNSTFINFKDFEPSFDFTYKYSLDKWATIKVLKEITLGAVNPSMIK